MTKKGRSLIPLALIIGIASGVAFAIIVSSGAFADKCVKCNIKGGDGGDGGDGGKAIAAPVGPGGSCLAIIIGDSCGGSTGSSEPRGGQGGDGGAGGDVLVFGDKTSDNRNSSNIFNSSNVE
jgi:hypothetical protein